MNGRGGQLTRRLTSAAAFGLASLQGFPAHAGDDAAANTPPVAVTLDYDAATVSDFSGGVAQSSTYIGNLHLRGLFDLDRALGWRDTRLFVDGLWIHGGNPDAAPGDALGVNNLTAPRRAQVEELWLEHNFDGDHFSALTGLYDINTEFYRSQSGGLFLNSAFGMGTELSQSGVEGPSTFPRTSLGVRLAYKPSDNTVVRAAVLDGVPVIRPDGRVRAFEAGDGELYVAEIAWLDRPGQAMSANHRMRIGRNAMLPAYDGKLAIGAWHYTALGASGVYAIADRVIAHVAGDSGRTISAFAQIGAADRAAGRFTSSASLGGVAVGPFRARPNDELGVAWATARDSGGAESTVELTYLAQVTSSIALQPDLQYVVHPNAQHTVPDAWVFSLRFEFSFGS